VVRGSRPEGPKIEVVSANVDLGRIEDSSRSQKASLSADIEKVRQELMAQMASDLRKLPSPELLEKYKL
jgi:hypothetical protein